MNIPINTPRDTGGIENMLGFLSSLIEGKSAIYISAPITTGNRFIRWYKERGVKLEPESRLYKEEHFKHVIRPNIEDVKKKIAELRHYFDTFIIDPTKFDYPEWTQDDYRYFWGSVIERHVKTVVLLDGWQYSQGSTFEYLVATRSDIEILSENLYKLEPGTGLEMIREAIVKYKESSLPAEYFEKVADELQITNTTGAEKIPVELKIETHSPSNPDAHYKDAILDRLALIGNVAQFVSFDLNEELTQRFSQVIGFKPNHRFAEPRKAVENLLESSPEGTVNIRSFQPGNPKGGPLIYGLNNIDDIMQILLQNAAGHKISIVNETIDINDGGVSGVTFGQIIEFSPWDTPKCVDKAGVCSLPRKLGLRVLESVYGFHPALNFPPSYRVEFSIHPRRRGLRQGHTILWELEEVNTTELEPEINWPNNFSRMLGDKVFGLLIADAIGLPVPLAIVIPRDMAPFTFGRKTGTFESWIRTCPGERVPGKYPTYFGWCDPFKLMAEEDAKCANETNSIRIMSVLAQQAVNPVFSGSLLTTNTDGSEPFIEGIRGRGDAFMIGQAAPIPLPEDVLLAVNKLYQAAFKALGPVEIEWVYDGEKAWVIQLHKSNAAPVSEIIYPGEEIEFVKFQVTEGLEALRQLIPKLKKDKLGIIVEGDIGITSHFGDILRKAEIPAKLARRK
ncbi:MAG: hypothetical protein MUF15_10110 [Acidobacteria bacterium]|nr:hypothetical protein [Acidobacteriota bacterium]